MFQRGKPQDLPPRTESVPAVMRVFQVLELLAQRRNGLTLTELARSLLLPRSSVHCQLLTMERLGYLHRHEETRRYLFGLKLFSLANQTFEGLTLRPIAAPHLRAVTKRTGMTVHLAILDHSEAVIIEKLDPPAAPPLGTWIGKRMSLHCTAVGKALISQWSDGQIERLIRQGLPRYNENTIVSAKRLKQELALVRTLGHSLDDQEEAIGSRCIGAPIHDQAGRVMAALSVSGSAARVEAKSLTRLAADVKATAALIGKQFGRSQYQADEAERGTIGGRPPDSVQAAAGTRGESAG